MLRRHVDKLKQQTWSPRSLQQDNRESEEEAPTQYEPRLHRAVKRQLSRGRTARRKLLELRQKIELVKYRRKPGLGATDGYASDGTPARERRRSKKKHGQVLNDDHDILLSPKPGAAHQLKSLAPVGAVDYDDEDCPGEVAVFPRDGTRAEDDDDDDEDDDDFGEEVDDSRAQRECGPLVETALGRYAQESDCALAALATTALAAVTTTWRGCALWLCGASFLLQLVALRRRIHHFALVAVRLSSGRGLQGERLAQMPKQRASKRKPGKLAVKSNPAQQVKQPSPHWSVPKAVPDGTATDANSWSAVPASTFSLRGPKYLQDRAKQPSEPAPYDPVAVHIFQTWGDRVPESDIDLLASLPCQDHHDGHMTDSRFPTYLAFQVSVPTEAPSMRGWWPGSPCWTVVIVFKITEATLETAARDQSEWPNSLKLLRSWLDTANTDPVMNSRLKGIFICRSAQSVPASPMSEHTAAGTNSTDAELADGADRFADRKIPRILQKWNGKPVLMADNPSGFSRSRKGISKLTSGPGFVEIAINVGESFSYMGRAAVYLMIGKLASLDCDVCFTIEGRSHDELPETVVGAITFSRLRLAEQFKRLQMTPSTT